MNGMQVQTQNPVVDINLPSLNPKNTRPGFDTTGAALATALLQETKKNMDVQFEEYNFLNFSA